MNLKIIAVPIISLAVAPIAFGDSLQNASQATADSADASVRIVASGGQVALGAVAIPLSGLGALAEAGGETATDISADLWDVANAPLKVDDAVMIAQPVPDLTLPANPAAALDGAVE